MCGQSFIALGKLIKLDTLLATCESHLAAGVPHGQDLQQVGGAEHALHVVLGDGDLPGVGVVQQPRDHPRLHPVQRDHVLDSLGETSREHRL